MRGFGSREMYQALLACAVFVLVVLGNSTHRTVSAYREGDLAKVEPVVTERLLSRGVQPPIYVITPTHMTEKTYPHLTRLLWILGVIENVIWIIVEDAVDIDTNLESYLASQVGHMSRHPMYGNTTMTSNYIARGKAEWMPNLRGCRGRLGRNAGLKYALKKAAYTKTGGWLYFLDDDNTISPLLFDEIRKIKKVGVFPVGNMAETFVSTPLITPNGTVGAFFDRCAGEGFNQCAGEAFTMDMAGFAFNVDFMLERAQEEGKDPGTFWSWEACAEARMEAKLMEKTALRISELEPLAQNCTEIHVWHTQTVTLERPTQSRYRWLAGVAGSYINAPAMLEMFKQSKVAIAPAPRPAAPSFIQRLFRLA